MATTGQKRQRGLLTRGRQVTVPRAKSGAQPKAPDRKRHRSRAQKSPELPASPQPQDAEPSEQEQCDKANDGWSEQEPSGDEGAAVTRQRMQLEDQQTAMGVAEANNIAINLACTCCGETPKDALWLEFADQVIRGSVVSLPKGDRCYKHGKVAMAWPLLGWDEFASMYKTVRIFRDAVDNASARMMEHIPPSLPDCSLDSMQRQGLRIFCQYCVFSVEEFMLRFKYPLEALGVPTVDIMTEYSTVERCVLVRDDSEPRRAHLFTDVSYDLREASMAMYLRPGQPRDTFAHLSAEVNAIRGTPTLADRAKCLTMSAVQKKAQVETEKRKALENQGEVDAAKADIAQKTARAQSMVASHTDSLVCRPAWMQQQQQPKQLSGKDKDRARRQPAATASSAAWKAAPAPSSRLSSGSSVSGGGSKRQGTAAAPPEDVASELVDLTMPASKRIRPAASAASCVSAGSPRSVVADRPPNYFDITAILLGTVRGQAVAGAQRHLRTLTGPQHTKRRQSLQQEIMVAESAYKCSPMRIHELTLPQLQQHLTVIVQNHPPGLPLITEAVHLKKYIDSVVHLRSPTQTFDAIRPWQLEGDVVNANKPMLSQLLKKVESKNTDHATYLTSALDDGFFGDALAALLAEPTVGGDGKEEDPPTATAAFCSAILEIYLEQEVDVDLTKLPDFIIDPLDEVMAFCRAVVVVTKPGIVYNGCSHADASHVFNPDHKVGLPSGTRTALTAIETNMSWKAVLSEFWSHFQAEEAGAEKYKWFCEQLSASPDFMAQPTQDILDELLDLLPKWMVEMREGSTEHLEAELRGYLKNEIYPKVSDGEPAEQNMACKLVGLIVAVLDPDAECAELQAMRSAVKVTLRAADHAAATSALYQAATSWTNAERNTEDLQLHLDRAKNASLNDEVASALRDMRAFVEKAMVEATMEQVSTGHFDKCAALLASIASFPEVVRDDKAANISTEVQHNNFSSAASKWASLVVAQQALKDAATQSLAPRLQLFLDYMTAHNSVLQEFPDINEEQEASLRNDWTFWGMRMKERATAIVESQKDWMQTEGGKLHAELAESLKTAIERLNTVNGGSNKQGESWKAGLDLSTMSTMDITTRADETLLRSFIEAMRKRRGVLQTILTKFVELEVAIGKATPDLTTQAKQSILQTIGTLFEGRVMQGLKFTGLAKKKHMATHLEEANKGIAEHCPGGSLSDYAHPVIIGYCKDAMK